MSTQNEHHGSIQQTLLRPYRLATILAAIALFVSLGFLTFTAWSSARRLDPLERHLTHLQGLQDSSLGIQELLIRHIEQNSPPLPEEIARIRSGLQEILDRGDHMHADTPAALREAMTFLQSDNANPEAGLLAALSVIRDTLKRENTLQRESVAATREAAQVEVLVAGAALILAPLSSFLLLAYIRRRSFRSLRLLSDLLENVGNLDFRTMEPPGENDPLTDVFQRYNLMADRLRKARDEQNRREETLEHQVRAASETLLRQQSDLADGARLAALGEFSARVAHELRNPISGITLALRNLESETEVDDHRERIGLVVEEMDRITRLLNTLLEQGLCRPEQPVSVRTRALVEDIVRLYRYQLPEHIEIRLDAEDSDCVLPRDTVRQVLLNLIRNSAEAMAPGTGEIRVDTHCNDETFRLTVSDTGPGYPDDILRHGIRPFQTGKAGGTGLGLSVIQRLIRSVGGELELSQATTGGASTTVTVPCKEH